MTSSMPQRAGHARRGRSGRLTRHVKRTLLLHGHRFTYRIAGDPSSERPVLLLIHGMAGSSGTWSAVIPGLAERYTVVAPDLLGHGESDKPRHDYSLGGYANMVRDLMIALRIERATIVGHSLGGGIAMQLAYQHPDRCERLVLVASGGLGPEISWIFRALTLPGAEYAMPVIFPPFIRTAGNVMSQVMDRLGLRVSQFEQGWRSYSGLTESANRHAFVHTLRSVIDRSGQTVSAHDRLYLSSLLPTLIVWGRKDRIIPVEHATKAHEALASSRLVIFDRAGHFPHADEPERFVDAVVDFVESTAPMHLDEPQWRAAMTAGPP